jgi:hypothetical protein
MLTQASDRFGLDRQGWTTVTEDAELTTTALPHAPPFKFWSSA